MVPEARMRQNVALRSGVMSAGGRARYLQHEYTRVACANRASWMQEAGHRAGSTSAPE